MELTGTRASDERLSWSRALPLIAALSVGLWAAVAFVAFRVLG